MVELLPSLRAVVEAGGLDAQNLKVGLVADNQGQVTMSDKHSVPLSDGDKVAWWPVSSLRELVRGHTAPPPPAQMNRYPPEYCTCFYFVESHTLLLCDATTDRTDQEMEQVYATLRRRPDGRSLGLTHDFLWQVAAVLLGEYALSQAEFEAIFNQLARSVQHWAQSPISRNYVAYLRRTFTSED